MKFNLNDYKGKNVCMHCRTEEDAKQFCDFLHKAGLKWISGVSYAEETYWYINGVNTVYYFNEGQYGKRALVSYDCMELEWDAFKMNLSEPTPFTKADLKNGDVVLRRDGSIEIICVETGTMICEEGYDDLKDIRDDLTCTIGEEYDIVKVKRPSAPEQCRFDDFEYNKAETVYERKKKRKVTLKELEKIFGEKIEIVE